MARIRELKRRLESTQSARVAMASDGDYKSYMEDLQSDLNMLLLGRDQAIKANWDWIRALARKGISR